VDIALNAKVVKR